MQFAVKAITTKLKKAGVPSLVSIPVYHLETTGEEMVDFFDIANFIEPYYGDSIDLQYLTVAKHETNDPIQFIKVYDKHGTLQIVLERNDPLGVRQGNQMGFKIVYVNEVYAVDNPYESSPIVHVSRYTVRGTKDIFDPDDILHIVNPHVNNMGSQVVLEGNFVEVKTSHGVTLMKLQRIY